MKRKIALMIALLITVLTVTGCGNNGLENYKEAVDKTDQIERGQSSGEFTLNMDFHTDGMSPEDIAELNYYKDVTGSFQSTFDEKSNQMIARNYLNFGGLGFDFDIYQNGDKIFVKLPIVGKYMELDEIIKEFDENQMPEEQSCMISEETENALSKEWVGILKDDNVFKGKDIVLTTADGEVKTTVYSITINDEQFKTLASNSVNILSKDENFKTNVNAFLKQRSGQSLSEEVDFEEFLADIRKQMEKDHLENFKYTAYVDIDGYIVNETLEFKMSRLALSSGALAQGEPEMITFKLDLENWDINKEQKFEFPALTTENTLVMDNLDETMPSLFKGMFKNNQ